MTEAERDKGAEDISENIRRSARTGLTINFLVQAVRSIIQFSSVVLLMRMLTPSDFGVVAMASPIIALTMMSNFGFAQAVVQRPEISAAQMNFLFWTGAAFSLSLAIVTLLTSPITTWYYGDARVGEIVAALSIVVLISGLGSQMEAILTRDLEFRRLGLASLCSYSLAVICGLTAAFYGFNYWSLVIIDVVASLSSLIIIWILSGWKPGIPSWRQIDHDLFKFGTNVSIFNVLSTTVHNIDNVLIGRWWGDLALGFYDRAFRLLHLPISAIVIHIGTTAIPALCRALEHPPLYRSMFASYLRLIVCITAPMVVFAYVFAHEVIEVALGQKWREIVPIFVVIALGALFSPVSTATSWLLLSQGRTRQMRNWGALSSIGFIIAIVVGLPWGPSGVAICYISFGIFEGPILWMATTSSGPVNRNLLLRTLLPLIVSECALLALLSTLDARATPAWLGGVLVGSYVFFLAVFWCFPDGRAQMRSWLAPLRRDKSLKPGLNR